MTVAAGSGCGSGGGGGGGSGGRMMSSRSAVYSSRAGSAVPRSCADHCATCCVRAMSWKRATISAAARLWRDLAVDGWGAEAGLAELIGSLRGVRRVDEKRAPGWLRRVEERLRATYGEPPALGDLAREAGVHPVHLSRTYRRFRGEGIGDFVRRCRVAEAARHIMKPGAQGSERDNEFRGVAESGI